MMGGEWSGKAFVFDDCHEQGRGSDRNGQDRIGTERNGKAFVFDDCHEYRMGVARTGEERSGLERKGFHFNDRQKQRDREERKGYP